MVIDEQQPDRIHASTLHRRIQDLHSRMHDRRLLPIWDSPARPGRYLLIHHDAGTLPGGWGTGPAAGDPSRCGGDSPRSARSPDSGQNSQSAGLLRMAALTSAAHRSNTVLISPSTGTGAEISSTWWR